MGRCTDLCTKDATGTCALCEARAEADRFVRLWFKGGLFLDCCDWLIARLGDQSKAPGCWLYPVPRVEVRHKDVVQEAHKQYSETLNKTMLTLLGVALFCMLITIGPPDKLLLAADSTIKIPFTDALLPFVGFIVVAPLLLVALFIYLHVFYGYWLDCERERRSINKRLIWAPPIESIPALFSFPDNVSKVLIVFVLYMLTPLALCTITDKARALPGVGYPLLYVTGVVSVVSFALLIRRRPDSLPPSQTLWDYGILAVVIGIMVVATVKPQWFQRQFDLFRTDLSQAWLPRTNMRNARALWANFQGANLVLADLQEADLRSANLQKADLRGASLQKADLRGANLQKADLREANLNGANLRRTKLQETKLMGAKNLTQDQVNAACLDENTQLPEGLIRPDPCPVEP